MKSLKYLLITLSALNFVLGGSLPQVTNAPVKRDDGSNVVIEAPLSDFTKTTSKITTPAGASVVVYPTDATTIPASGYDIAWGPDLHQQLVKRADTDCSTIGDQCINSVDVVFGGSDGDLARRGIGRLIGGKLPWRVGKVFTMIVSYLVASWKFHSGGDQPPNILHMPSHVIAQASSATKADKVIFKTAADDSKPITATVSESDATATGGPISIVDADGNGHHKGDIELELPSKGVLDALKKMEARGRCPSSKTSRMFKRVDNVAECVTSGYESIINELQGNGMLHELQGTLARVPQNFPPERFANQQINRAFGPAMVRGAEVIPPMFPGLRQEQLRPIVTFIFMIAISWVLELTVKNLHIFVGNENLAQSQDFKVPCPDPQGSYRLICSNRYLCNGKDKKCTDVDFKDCPCQDAECPIKAKDFPLCKNCAGKAGNKCSTGEHKDCLCIGGGTLHKDAFMPAAVYDNVQTILKTTGTWDPKTDLLKGVGDPICDKQPMDPEFNRPSAMIFGKFCEQVGEDPAASLSQIVDELGDAISHKQKRDDNQGLWTFFLRKTEGKGECWLSCDDYFSFVFGKCGQLGDDKKSLAKAGGMNTPCGQYEFVVNKPIGGKPSTPTCTPKPTEAPYSPGQCTVDVTQIETGQTKANGQYTLEAWIHDNGGAEIGHRLPALAGPQGNDYYLDSKLEDELIMIPSTDHHGMVSFQLGHQTWDTVNNNPSHGKKVPWCEYSKDSDTGGSSATGTLTFKVKKYTCYIQCTWGGGMPKDFKGEVCP